ncbi:MAG: hypothetical protein HYZ53_23275 [Planctomycetes bacterium]|nr:hypothetical protein [Planctomycetota bacterium]
MRIRMRVGVAVAAGLLSGLCTADEVRTTSQEVHKGVVVQENVGGLVLALDDTGRATRQFGWERVAGVRYDPAPDGLEEAERLTAERQYEAALAAWKALRPRATRRVVLQRVLHGIAQSLGGLGRQQGAADAYADLLREFPDTRHFEEAWSGLVRGRLAAAVGGEAGGSGSSAAPAAVAAAAADLARAEAAASTVRGLPPAFALELRLLKAELREAEGRYREAEAEFRAVAGAAGGAPERGCFARARIGQARCRLALGEGDAARRLFGEAADTASDRPTRVAAHTGVGESLCPSAHHEEEPARWREALFAYLHAVVALDEERASGTAEEGKPYFLAGMCAERLAALCGEAPASLRATYLRRARELYEDALGRSKSGEWAEKARAALAAMARRR